MTTVSYRFQVAGHTAAEWTGGNPILLDREWAVERDTGKVKLGDGATAWNSLAYFFDPTTLGGGGGSAAWGSITGSLSSQTDLQTALDGKLPGADNWAGDATSYFVTYPANGIGFGTDPLGSEYTWFYPGGFQIAGATVGVQMNAAPNANGRIDWQSTVGLEFNFNPYVGTARIALVTDLPHSVTSRAANYTETATTGEVIIKFTASGKTATLPTAVGNTAKLTFKLMVAGTLTVAAAGGETIDGGATATLSSQYEALTLVSDNANWIVI